MIKFWVVFIGHMMMLIVKLITQQYLIHCYKDSTSFLAVEITLAVDTTITSSKTTMLLKSKTH